MEIFSVAYFFNDPSSSESLYISIGLTEQCTIKVSSLHFHMAFPCCDYTRKSVVQPMRAVATLVQRASELYHQPEVNMQCCK